VCFFEKQVDKTEKKCYNGNNAVWKESDKMEYLIVSDSHGNVGNLRTCLSRQITPPAGIFFLGDGLRDLEALEVDPQTFLYRVRGNCDFFSASDVPNMGLTSVEGHTVLFVHGHLFSVKSGYGALLANAARLGADIVLSGHTHVPYEEVIPAGTVIGGVALEKTIRLFNPGSVGYNTDGLGASFGTLLLRGETVLFSHGRIEA